MFFGLRVLLFKLFFFKVKRLLEFFKIEKLGSFVRKRSNIEFIDVFERDVKKRILGEGEVDMEIDLECSFVWDRRS